jgi:hypothetical protein
MNHPDDEPYCGVVTVSMRLVHLLFAEEWKSYLPAIARSEVACWTARSPDEPAASHVNTDAA